MKRITAILLILMMILALVGCGKAGEKDASVTAQPTEETTSDERHDAPPDGPGGTPPDGTPPSGGPGGTPPDGTPPSGGPGGPGGDRGGSVEYNAAESITSARTVEGESYSSSSADENALLVATSEAVTLKDITAVKTGDSDGGDNCSFYGVNSAILAKDGAELTISGGSIETSAEGANGVFSYGGNGGRNGAGGDGTGVVISDVTITTTGGGSGGIMTAGGGITEAHDLTVTTSGRSSAAIRSDRGGGTVTVDGGTYTTNGLGSPAIYSTADISVTDAELISTLSEGVVIEGKNRVVLTNCTVSANNTATNSNASFFDAVMIYQSMSGDAANGTAEFSMTGGSITCRSGHVIHVTNTKAEIELSGVEIVSEDAEKVLLSVCSDGWSGAENSAELTAKNQELEGKMLVGSDSELVLRLTDGSQFTGVVSGEITNAKGEKISSEVGSVTVSIDETSTWTLTGDCSIAAFEGDPARVVTNGYTLLVGGAPLGD